MYRKFYSRPTNRSDPKRKKVEGELPKLNISLTGVNAKDEAHSARESIDG